MNNTDHRTAFSGVLRRVARLLIVAVFAIPAPAVLAGTIVVTHFDDVIDDNDGSCTLREAIRSANGNIAIDGCAISGVAGDDVIVLTAGTYTVDLASGTAEDASVDGDLDIVSSLEIRGIAPEYTIIDGDAETAQERVFDVRPNAFVTIRDVTITGGHEPGGSGGNIQNLAEGSMAVGLTLHNVVVSGGRAVLGGGIYAGGDVAILRSVVRDNETVGDSGGGGGIAFGGTSLSVLDSEIDNNRAAVGGGLYGFGTSPWSVSDSRVTENEAVAGAGAESRRGGGIASTGGPVTVTRTLIEGNEAESGGGVWLAADGDEVTHSAIVGNTASENGGGVFSTGDAFVRHSTIAGNGAASGGGAHAASPMQLLLDAVTLAGNTGGGGIFNESGASIEFSLLADNAGGNCLGNEPTAGMLNLDDGDTCFPANDPNNPQLVNEDPMLGPLQDNGGGLPTFAFLEGSPAIDAVSSTVRPNCQDTPDQRGYPRGWPPVLATGQDPEFLCDIGAFERHAAYIVDTTADTVDEFVDDGICADASGNCSLRAAIMTANTVPGFEEIELAADTYAITQAGADENEGETGDLDITDVVLIRGQGAGQTIVDAAQFDRALHFLTPMMAKEPRIPAFSVLSDLTIQQGAADEGGGILADRPLRLERTVLRDNSATSGDGGALLCVDDCDLWITDSTLAANSADAGAGGAILHDSGGVLHLERSTLSGNSAKNGGAIEATGRFRALNTTFSGNMAASSAAFDAVRAVLESSTVFDNESTLDTGTGGLLLLRPSVIVNSIVAGNRNGGGPDNCGFEPGGIVSVGFNLSDTDSADCNFTHATDLVDTDPLLDELADNDAMVQTHALTAESPAVDAGDNERCPAMDQRGVARPADGNNDGTAACDIGAFELEPEPEPEPPSEPPPPSGGGSGGGGATGPWLLGLALIAGMRRRLLAAALTTSLACTVATAATVEVTGFDDVVDDADSICSLREAIRAATLATDFSGCEFEGSGVPVILLSAGTYKVDLASGTDENDNLDGDLDIAAPMIFQGVASDYTVIDGDAATSAERVFHVLDADVAFQDLTIMGGSTSDFGGNLLTGPDASVRLSHVVVRDGRARFTGGGLASYGDLEVIDSRFTANDAVQYGGGLAAFGDARIWRTVIADNHGGNAGGIYVGPFDSRVRILDSRIVGNTATGGENNTGFGGGIFIQGDTLDFLMQRTLVADNTATFGGGIGWEASKSGSQITHSAIVNNQAAVQGGGIRAEVDNAALRHSTVSGNSAPSGGGIYTASSDLFLLDAVTLAGNTAGDGLFNEAGAFVEYSILADNEGRNCSGATPGAGPYNLDDDDTCALPNDANLPNLIAMDPMLGPLQDNGGGLPTMALLPGSPAIDAYDSEERPNCQTVPDQRTYPRGYPPVNGDRSADDHLCDIGAYEFSEPFIVDSTIDTVDADPDDGVCADSSGACTLRAAIMQANATPFFNEIVLDAGTYELTLAGADENAAATGDLDISDDVRITGQGSAETVINGGALDRIFEDRAVMLSDTAPIANLVELRDMTLTGGFAGEGGAIYASQRTLRLERLVIEGNEGGSGGALYCPEGCELIIVDSTLATNLADDIGGAIFYGGESRLWLDGTTVYNNSSASDGGGVVATEGFVRATNTTVSANVADTGGGVAAGRAVLENATIVDNQAVDGGAGVFLLGPAVLVNTIIAGNRLANGDIDNCAADVDELVSLGHNLSDGDSTDCHLTASTDLVDTDPLIGPLADNGGPTRTHALLTGSPAIDAGGDTGCPPTDQRGFARPDDGDGDGTAACDIGAYETLSADLAIAIGDSPDPVDVGNDVTYTVTVTNNGPGPASQVVVSTTFPAGLDFVSADAGGTDCTASGGAVDCEIGDIASGDSVEIRIVATAAQSGELTVEATVTAAEADGATADNTVTETTTVNSAGGGGGGSGGDGNGGGGGGGAVSWPVLLGLLAFCHRRRFRERTCGAASSATTAAA